MVHGAVDQRGGHVLVAEHSRPAGELDVRGVDDAPGLVGIRYDLEQEPGALFVDRHVAELVDDQEPRPGDLLELRVEPVRVPRQQRALAMITELADHVGGAAFVFDVQVHGPVALIPAALRHRVVSSRLGSSRKRHHLEH